MPDVFISYSRRDVEFVRELHAALAAHDKDIWADWEDIPITAEWLLEVYRGIESSDNFLFVITPDSLASDVCARELAHAVEKNKRLVPVLRREAAPGTTVPGALAARNWTFFRPDDDFAAAVDALVVALDTDLDWVRAHTRLLGRSLEWEKLDRDSSFLLRGRDLDDAEQWAAARSPDHEPQPTPLQLEYVLASRSSATRRQRITVTAALVAVVVAASLAVLALVQRNEAVEQQAVAERQARLALSRQLAAQSEAALDRDPEQSVVLAARAATTAATDEARDQLRRALRGSRLRSVIDAREPVRGVALDGQGRLVAAALDSGRVGVWNLRTGRRLTTSGGPAVPARSVDLSGDGSRALGAGERGVTVWRISPDGLEPLATLDTAHKPLAAVFDPTGDVVATGDFDGVVRLWAAEHGRAAGRAPRPRRAVPGDRGRVQRRRLATRRSARLAGGRLGRAHGIGRLPAHAGGAGPVDRVLRRRPARRRGRRRRRRARLEPPQRRRGRVPRPRGDDREPRLQPGRRVAGHGERGRDGGDLGCPHRDVDRRAPRTSTGSCSAPPSRPTAGRSSPAPRTARSGPGRSPPTPFRPCSPRPPLRPCATSALLRAVSGS